jgi:hypothetical protein
LGHLRRLHEAYKDRVAFLLVLIKDAGHSLPEMHPYYKELRAAGGTPEAWDRLIRGGLDLYKVPFPALLDEGGHAERAYAAHPKRLVIVGADGLVVYDGARGAKGGPSDWDLDEVEEHLGAAVDAVTSSR